ARRVAAPGGDAALPAARRRAHPRHDRRDPARPQPRRLVVPLPPRRRLRAPDGGVRDLHLLAGRGARRDRPARRGARRHGPRARGAVAPGPRVRGRGDGHDAHVGELPAGVLARRVDPRGVRGIAAVVGDHLSAASAAIAARMGPARSGSDTIPASSSFLPDSGTAIDASGTTRAAIVRSVSASWACAWSDRGEALTRAIGLSLSTVVDTSQSSRFFIDPGTPWAYSGLQIMTASAAPTRARRSATAGGGAAPSPSRSGLKWGRWPMPS